MNESHEMTAAQQVGEKSQLFAWWCGLAFFFLFFLATWPMMEFIPPPEPWLSADELVARVADHALKFRAGIIVGFIAAFLIVPWSAVVAIQISRLEGRFPLFAITAFGVGVANAVAFFFPYMMWAGAFYRLDRNLELVKLINDISWLEWIMTIQPTAFQLICIGVAGLVYKGSRQVFPRWFSYLNLWVALLFCPGMLALFFQSGPFAWNGLFCFWLPVVSFVIYFPVSLVVFRRAIKTHRFDVA